MKKQEKTRRKLKKHDPTRRFKKDGIKNRWKQKGYQLMEKIEITKEMIDNKEVDYIYWADAHGDCEFFTEFVLGFNKALKKWNLTAEYGLYENDCEQWEWYIRIKPLK